jgi:hypothetical protein
MAKSRAQQAAIAISMKKAGKKPKKMKNGGKSKTLNKVSKQLAKASKLHAAQSKKIGKLAQMMKEGGYPKSSDKEFMRRMGYYQAGGLATPPMYGINTIPGVQETANVTYEESDKEKLARLEKQLEEAQQSNKFQEEAAAELAAQQAKADRVEGTISKGFEALDKAPEALDKLKQAQTALAGRKASKEFAKKMAADAAKRQALGIAAKDFTTEGIKKAGEETSKILADQIVPGAAKEIVLDKAKDQGFQSLMGFGQDQASQFAIKEGTEVIGKEVLEEGAETLGKEALKEVGKEGAKQASQGLIKSSVNPNPYATAANIVGKGIEMAADDADATTFTAGEATGKILGTAGEYAGYGAMLGSVVPVVGNVAGAVGGAIIGAGKAAIQGTIQRNKARKAEERAEKKRLEEIQSIAQKSRLESMKDKEYSGFDFGADIARYGGYYQSGGLPNFPAAYLNKAKQLSANQPKQGVIKATDESLANKLYQGAKRFTASQGAPTELLGELTGIPSAMRIAQSYKNVAAKPSTDTAIDAFANTVGVVPVGKVATSALKKGLPFLKKADDALKFVGGSKLAKGFKGKKVAGSTVEDSDIVMRRHGGVKLPGGVAKPIPGSDAIEFKGRSHEQGGIMVDPMTEVEGDETMDQVTMKKGGKRDYFFSQHLKMGGKSFAQRHKDILKKGGSQRDIDALAKLQEKKAGRNPNTVKLGAGGYYQLGGIDKLGNVIVSDVNMDGIDDFSQGISFRNDPLANNPLANDPLAPSGTLPTASEDEVTVTPTKPKEEEKREEFNFTPIQPKTITQIPVNNSIVPGTYVDLEGNTIVPQGEMGPEESDYNSLSEEDQNIINKAKSGDKLTEMEEKALRRLNRDVPGIAAAAGIAQLIAPAYAFFKKDRAAEQMGSPGRIKAPTLDRVSFNTERAANAADNRAINRFIETSGVGPAGIIAKMSAYRRKQEGDMKIAAQESRINTQIANQEAQMAQQANIRNIANRMQVDQINTRLREAQLAANENRRLEAVDAFTERTAGLAGDLLSYKANERLARATGDLGIYERDRLRNFLRNEINPRTGKPYTNAEIAKLFNIRFGEAQPTKEDNKKDKDE